MIRSSLRICLAVFAAAGVLLSLSANAQMDLSRARWRLDTIKSDLESRERDLSDRQKALLARRDEIDRTIAALTEARKTNDEEILRVRHDLNRIHLELLQ